MNNQKQFHFYYETDAHNLAYKYKKQMCNYTFTVYISVVAVCIYNMKHVIRNKSSIA